MKISKITFLCFVTAMLMFFMVDVGLKLVNMNDTLLNTIGFTVLFLTLCFPFMVYNSCKGWV